MVSLKAAVNEQARELQRRQRENEALNRRLRTMAESADANKRQAELQRQIDDLVHALDEREREHERVVAALKGENERRDQGLQDRQLTVQRRVEAAEGDLKRKDAEIKALRDEAKASAASWELRLRAHIDGVHLIHSAFSHSQKRALSRHT